MRVESSEKKIEKGMEKMLWRVDLLLGNDLETRNETTSAAGATFLVSKYRQPLLSNAFTNKHLPTESIGV
jgi:hypothetical protein